jgi:hypothetical protein
MSVASGAARSSAARTRRYRARRGQGARCVLVDVSETEVAALVARSYLPEEASRDPAAIKAAVEGLMADVVFELEAERADRNKRGKRVTTRDRDA